jgi:hypothetical protein
MEISRHRRILEAASPPSIRPEARRPPLAATAAHKGAARASPLRRPASAACPRASRRALRAVSAYAFSGAPQAVLLRGKAAPEREERRAVNGVPGCRCSYPFIRSVSAFVNRLMGFPRCAGSRRIAAVLPPAPAGRCSIGSGFARAFCFCLRSELRRAHPAAPPQARQSRAYDAMLYRG